MITCCNCRAIRDPSQFVDHLLENNLRCLNASYRQRLYNSQTVAISLSVQKESARSDIFVCFVCKACEELGLYKDFLEERGKFEQFHASRCGHRFSEIEHHMKPSATELYEAQKVIQYRKHPTCLKCGYDAGGNESNLKRHMANCKGKKERDLTPCTKCGYDAGGNYSNLKRHKEICKGPKEKVKKCCPKCGYDGKGNTSNLSRHMATCKGPKEQKAISAEIPALPPSPSQTLPPSPPPSPPPQNTVIFTESEKAIPDWFHKRLFEVKDHYEIRIDDEDYSDEEVFNMLFQDVKKADENMNRAVAKQQARSDALTKEVSQLKDELFELCCLIQSIRREDRGIISKLAAPTTMGIVTRIIGDTEDDDFSDFKDDRTQLQKMDDQLYERDHTISILKSEIKKLKKAAEEKDSVIETFKTIKIKGGSGSDSDSDSDWD